MNLLRFILLVVVVWLVFRLVKRFLNRPSKDSSRISSKQPGDMVRCEQCGLHIPKIEAMRDGEHYYCSRQHLEESKGKHSS
ncbi:MAG: hypothetical protein IDH49_01245 [Gammaproteobacteria bacterium]|nr:hypothetical protein [Gammaproteobacteria bacterium]